MATSKFDLNKAFNGSKIVTRNGNKVDVICEFGGKVLVNIHKANNLGLPYQVKVNLDGSRYNANYPHHEDLFMVE